MDLEQVPLSNALEVELIGALAFTEAKELVDREGPDYFRGFIQGYAHCLKLAQEFDETNIDKEIL